MAIVITGNGIDMGNNPVSNASQIDGVVINENNESVATENLVNTKTTLTEANSYDLGVGQTWQDVTSSRSVGVTYTNTTGKPIAVHVAVHINQVTAIKIIIDGSIAIYGDYTPANNLNFINAIIPSGSTYNVTFGSSGTVGIYYWSELR